MAERKMRAKLSRSRRRMEDRFQTLRQLYVDNFIFVHINKTGGSSIGKALNLTLEHKSAVEKIEQIGRRKWDERFTFTVVRNPWDKVVSHYHYRVKTNQTGLGDRQVGFEEWVRFAYGDQDPRYYDKPRMFRPQSDWITDRNGEVLVDRVCHFENLEQEFQQVCELIGKNLVLPHVKSSSRGRYMDYYSDASVAIVERWFREDIERFGYMFEGLRAPASIRDT